MKTTLPILTKAEEDIMQIIWNLDECLVKDIIQEVGQPDIPHSTISSVVRILEKKGFLTHKAYGKTHVYRPIISKEVYAQQNVSGLIKKYFSNSPKQLVSFLVEQHDLDLEELNKLLLSLAKTKKELKS